MTTKPFNPRRGSADSRTDHLRPGTATRSGTAESRRVREPFWPPTRASARRTRDQVRAPRRACSVLSRPGAV